MKKITMIFGLVTLAYASYGQLSEASLSAYFAEINAGRSPRPLFPAGGQDHPVRDTYDLLHIYLKDSSSLIRAQATALLHQVTRDARSTSDRQSGTSLLLASYDRADAGQKGVILTYLQRYNLEDFSISTRNDVRELVRQEPPHFDRILQLAGFLQLQDLIPEIRPWTQPGNPMGIRWSAYLSLARLGDISATTAVLKRAKTQPVNDDVVYALFPDLIYTRSPHIIAYVVEALLQENMKCLTPNADREVPMDCGYRIMEQLAPVIQDFPMEIDENGDLKTDNYKEALDTVRTWFRAHPDYTILSQTW